LVVPWALAPVSALKWLIPDFRDVRKWTTVNSRKCKTPGGQEEKHLQNKPGTIGEAARNVLEPRHRKHLCTRKDRIRRALFS